MRDPRITAPVPAAQDDSAAEAISKAAELGQALGSNPPDIGLLQQTHAQLQQSPTEAWQSFQSAFVAAIETHQRDEWVAALATALTTACNHEPTSEHDREMIQGAARHWRETLDPFAVWGNRWAFGSWHLTEAWGLAGHLLAIDPGRALQCLEKLPHPGLYSTLLSLSGRDDRDFVLKMIRHAPLAFDGNGDWVAQRSVAALVVSDHIMSYARALHEALSSKVRVATTGKVRQQAVAELQQAESCELPAWFEEAFTNLIQRDDGLSIVMGYLRELARNSLLGSGQHASQPTPEYNLFTAALQTLAGVLRNAGVDLSQLRQFWDDANSRAASQRAAEGPRVQRQVSSRRPVRQGEGCRTLSASGLPLLYGGALLLEDKPAPQQLEALWCWFERLLVGRDDHLSFAWYESSRQRLPKMLAGLFVQVESPAERLRDAYLTLQPQRRRMQYSYQYDDYDIDVPSRLLLKVGMYLCCFMTAADESSQSAQELLLWIYEQARGLLLTAHIDTNNEKMQLVLDCFAFVPHVFADAIGDALQTMVPPIANDATMLSVACSSLVSNQVRPERVRELSHAAGGDVVTALQKAHQRAAVAGRAELFPKAAQELAEALKVKLD